MKNLLLSLLLALVSFHAFGQGDPPPFIKGQAASGLGNSASTVLVPAQQSTKINAYQALIETGNLNLLANPSFEHSTYSTGWTTSGSATFSAQTSSVPFGSKFAQFVTSSNTGLISQDSTLTANLSGNQCVASAWVNNTAANISVCSRVAGAVTANCAAVATDGLWHQYLVYEPCSGTSTGVQVYATANTTGTTKVDLLSVRPLRDSDSPEIGISLPWQACTVTGTWTSNTTYTCRYQRDGDTANFDITVSTSGAPTSTSLKINFPAGFVVDTNKMSKSDSSASWLGVVNIRDSGTASYTGWTIYEDTASFAVMQSSLAAVTATAPMTWASGDTANIKLSGVPIVGWSGSGQVVAGRCSDARACAPEFSARLDSSKNIITESFDWISGNGSGGTGILSLTFNTGMFTVTPVCGASPYTAGDTTAPTCWVDTVSTSAVTFRCGKNATGLGNQDGYHVWCKKQSTDAANSQNPVIVGSFSGVAQAPSMTSAIKECKVKWGGTNATSNCTTGTCFEILDNCGTATTTYAGTTGNYSVDLAAGTCQNSGEILGLSCEGIDATGSGRKCSVSNAASAPLVMDSDGGITFNVNLHNNSGTAQNAMGLLTFECYRP